MLVSLLCSWGRAGGYGLLRAGDVVRRNRKGGAPSGYVNAARPNAGCTRPGHRFGPDSVTFTGRLWTCPATQLGVQSFQVKVPAATAWGVMDFGAIVDLFHHTRMRLTQTCRDPARSSRRGPARRAV